MKKIIVRNTILTRGHINSAFISLCKGEIFSSSESLLSKNGIRVIMKELYNEDIRCDNLVDSELFKAYNVSCQCEMDSDYFYVMYKMDDEFAIRLTENIYLYHIVSVKGEVYSDIIPWVYADGRIFLGDTWWETDEEILENIKTLSVVDFIKRYKGY